MITNRELLLKKIDELTDEEIKQVLKFVCDNLQIQQTGYDKEAFKIGYKEIKEGKFTKL